MNIKSAFFLLVVLAFGPWTTHAQTKKNTKKTNSTKTVVKQPVQQVKLVSTTDSLSYALGLDIAESLKESGFELNVNAINLAIKASFDGDSAVFNNSERREIIQEGVRRVVEKKNEEAKRPGLDFLEKNKQNPNIKTTPEGVQYEVLVQGNGAQASVNDEVVVHYMGTLINGKQFDSSYDRNAPLTLNLNSVIEGWKIGIPLMQVGSKYRFFVPYNLAYGERNTGAIPAFSTLIFEVELLEVKGKNAI